MVWSLQHRHRGVRTPGPKITALFLTFLTFFSLASALQADEPRVAPSALRQMQALSGIKATTSKVQKKIDSRLYLGLLNQRRDARLSPLTDFRFVKPEADGRVAVEILLSDVGGMKAVLQVVESAGGEVKSASAAYRVVSARVRLSDLEALAAIPQVRKVRQEIPAFTHKINTSEGDRTHGAEQARGFFGVSGAGVKVCVLSDGVDSLAALQASGDLPAVDVLPGQAGSGDEGSAMLEIIHDLAPGATLGFATALPTQAAFAQNILDLAADGCNVIVDDIIYLAESPFQDQTIAQAVNTVTAAGVSFFSSAGNEGNKTDLTSGTWEGDFVPNGTPAVLAGNGVAHNFGDGGQSILVEFGNTQTPVILIWAEHYDLTTGLASTDYDLYDLNGAMTSVFDASLDVQDGTGGDDFPIEFIGGGAFAGERLVVMKFADGTTSSDPMFNLILFRGELDDDLTTPGTTRGHSAAADAFSVAATPAAESFDGVTPDGPYPGLFTSANESESFTSDGPRRIILDPTGAELTPGNRTSTGGVVRQKPDITAADGVDTAAPGFNPFYGTSAAAPHAAAIAALIKSAQPGLTPAQVRTALINSAIDIEAPGVDRDTGAGIIMAQEALEEVGAEPQAFLSAGTAVPAQVIGDGDAFVENNEVWDLTVPLTNAGGDDATGISAILTSSTPGVTILSGSSTYPDLAPSASGNNATPYTFSVSGAVPCGGLIQFTLTVTYTGGDASPQTFNFSIQTGGPGTPATFSYTGPAVPIPDGTDLSGASPGAPASASLVVAGAGNIYDVNFSIDGATCSAAAGSTTVGLDHTFVNDLEITLISPTATTAMVINNTDGSGNNFCQTVLDDESAGPSIQSVLTAQAPFTGNFTPASPLSIFDGEAATGAWQLQAQDYFSGDTGSIRAFSVTITPAVCDAPALTTTVTGTKTVSGTFSEGGAVTYTVTLTNNGSLAQADNAGDELTDVLPSSLTLVSASASSGTAVATVGTNTVTWNGALAPLGGSVTITINAMVNAGTGGTTISNQGSISYDGNGDGTNEGSGLTDDPGTAPANDPTSFAVAVTATPTITGTKTVSGSPVEGSNITYTIVLTNSGTGAQPDNPGDELTDVLPSTLTLVSASASSGAAVATVATNTVTWNGSIPASGSVTITIIATVETGTAGQTISNQATFIYDANADGTNETTGVTDNPATGTADDPTSVVALLPLDEIPTLSEIGLIALCLALAGAAMHLMRRRRTA
jgi:uncharacterized repeat protein (TIGR01451 family)